MDRFDRIFELHKIFEAHRYPVPTQVLMERLDCSRATVMRCIEALRTQLNAPVVYDRVAGGFHYAATANGVRFELPGLWFTAAELETLLVMQELLCCLEPGLLAERIAPLRARVAALLRQGGVEPAAVHRVRVFPVAARPVDPQRFQLLASALFERRRVRLGYRSRGDGRVSERDVSPQRLVRYRDNWYLDAWCHWRDGLRSFALDAIDRAEGLVEPARELPDTELDTHFTGSYGIFAGPGDHLAVLRFTAERARWVAVERWHPDQVGHYLPDGGYQLQVPYSDQRELLMDILKYGPDVEVVAPQPLREAVAQRLAAAARRYR